MMHLAFSRGVLHLARRQKKLLHIESKPPPYNINRDYNPPYVKLGIAAVCGSLIFYDGVFQEFVYTGATLRFLRSVKTVAVVSIDYTWLFASHNKDHSSYEDHLKAVHLRSAKRILEACLKNGGLYIKVGQGFAAINHVLPEEYIKTLSILQDECLPTTREDVNKVFRHDFGVLPEQLFKSFDYEPVAAASLAQVFKATLPNGQPVAVKVQYSDLETRFTSDLGTLMLLQNIIEWCFKSYNFGWIMRDLRENLVQELNFMHEGKNAEKCAEHLRKFSYASVPKVYWEYTKRRILTMEWIDGFKISDIARIKKENLNLCDIDKKLFHIFAEQIFNTGFVHADPHPGNSKA